MKHASRSQYVRLIPHPGCVCRLHSWVPLTVLLFASLVVAAPPIEPTLPPFYSFDCASPSVADGTVGCDDILIPGPNDTPIIVIRGVDIGIPVPGDDVDACSGPSQDIAGGESFAILISVERESEGSVPPDPNLVIQGVPYNVADQAEKGQAAGDQCMSLDLFTRDGPLTGSNGRAVDNNSLLRNNYNEGGTGFGADPETSAAESAAARGLPVPQDNVDCMFGTRVPTDPRGPANLLPLYYSTSSGADISFFGVLQKGGPPQTSPYASFADLGLVLGDDISAMIVIDVDGDESFEAPDQIIFSLAPGSPSLLTIGVPGKSASAADVFTVDGSGNTVVFIAAAGLGLDPSTDVISALDFLSCTDATACALLHCIREASIPVVSTWGMIVMTALMLVAGTLVWMRRRVLAA